MNESVRSGLLESPLVLIEGDAHPALARSLARELGVEPHLAEVGAFADGETRVKLGADVRGAAVLLVQPTGPPVNDHLMVLALLADAARAAGAVRVTAVVPYFGYARQDRREGPGEPRSAQVAAKLLASVGIDHLVTLDLHDPALESALPMPATLLGAEEVFLPVIRGWGLKDVTVVAPDAGGVKRAQRYAAALGGRLAVVAKQRPRPDATATLAVLGDVAGRACLIVDDMVSTGHTLIGAATALLTLGAREVHATFTHPVMAPGALDRICAAPFDRMLTGDSIPPPASARVEVVSIAPVLARALRGLGGGDGSAAGLGKVHPERSRVELRVN
jgi:ribose-phosphate pyrophosphokinase